jgi:hypothetical protein
VASLLRWDQLKCRFGFQSAAPLLRSDSPRSTMRCDACTTASRIASARVGSARYSCQAFTGSWLVISAERLRTFADGHVHRRIDSSG